MTRTLDWDEATTLLHRLRNENHPAAAVLEDARARSYGPDGIGGAGPKGEYSVELTLEEATAIYSSSSAEGD